MIARFICAHINNVALFARTYVIFFDFLIYFFVVFTCALANFQTTSPAL